MAAVTDEQLAAGEKALDPELGYLSPTAARPSAISSATLRKRRRLRRIPSATRTASSAAPRYGNGAGTRQMNVESFVYCGALVTYHRL